jgi:hypothetical protein
MPDKSFFNLLPLRYLGQSVPYRSRNNITEADLTKRKMFPKNSFFKKHFTSVNPVWLDLVNLSYPIYKAIATEIMRWNDILTRLYTSELAVA